MIKPIAEYQNYFLTANKKLFGLDEQGKKLVDVIDQDGGLVNMTDFFSKSGELFFTVKTIDNSDPENIIEIETFYKQKDGEISEIDTLPTKPAISRSSLNNEEFSINNADKEYFNEVKEKNTICSDVQNLHGKRTDDKGNIVYDFGAERFFMVDGFAYFSGSRLYFNVSDGRYNSTIIVRQNGLYFWDVGKSSISRIAESGEIW